MLEFFGVTGCRFARAYLGAAAAGADCHHDPGDVSLGLCPPAFALTEFGW